MRYAAIRKFDVTNGPGNGVSLFVQGCHFHCYQCFNPETWDFNGGKEWTEDIENKFIELVKRPYITRVSILGGEPLADENVADVSELVSRIKTETNKKIWLYTGYTWEYLIKENRLMQNYTLDSFVDSDNERQYWKYLQRHSIISLIDVLVDGQFIDELKDMNLPFRGSSNQRLIDVKKTIDYWYKGENKIIEYEIKN